MQCQFSFLVDVCVAVQTDQNFKQINIPSDDIFIQAAQQQFVVCFLPTVCFVVGLPIVCIRSKYTRVAAPMTNTAFKMRGVRARQDFCFRVLSPIRFALNQRGHVHRNR